MAKEKVVKDKTFKVKYGKDTYIARALPTPTVAMLGFRLQPKLVGLSIISGGIALDKFNQGQNIESYYNVLAKVFAPEDWEWLMDEILYNENYPIQLNGYYLNREEIDQHFAGDFCRLNTVLLRFAYMNLGEFKDLLASLTGSAKNIATYLTEITNKHLQGLEQSLKNSKDLLDKKSVD